MRRIFLYFAVAVVLSLHSLAVLWALALDAAAAPFAALLPPTELGDGVRTVVLMHHKRLPELEATLRRLAAAARASSASARPLIVHVAQSLRPSEAAAANATGGLLKSLAPQLAPAVEVWHAPAILPVESDAVDGSYSVDARKFGTKKNSFRNMVRGLDAAFGGNAGAGGSGAVPPSHAIVMEDDIEVSLDLLAYFDMAASLVDATRTLQPPSRIGLATSFCILKSRHRDYGYKGWLPGDWLPLRTDRYRRIRLEEVTFKTFAWLASREVYEIMRRDTSSMFQLPGTAKELHYSLEGCPYCSNFCYDHYLEWRFRNESIVCPEYPRARQYVLNGGGGMTEKPKSVEEDRHAKERSGTLLNQEAVPRHVYADGAMRQRARRLLNGLAMWAMAVGGGGVVLVVAPVLLRRGR